jgi:hypothetical protein
MANNDNEMKVGVVVDASDVPSGLKQVESDVKKAGEAIRSDAAKTAEVTKQADSEQTSAHARLLGRLREQEAALKLARTETANMVSGLGNLKKELAESGASAETAAMETAAWKAELESAAAAELKLSAGIAETKLAIKQLTPEVESMTGGFYKAVMANQALYTMTGQRLPRAMEIAIGHSQLLGKALEMAFPYMMAAMLGETIANDIVKPILEWRDGLADIKEYEETIGKIVEEQARKVRELNKERKEAHYGFIGATSGPSAENKARQGDLLKDIEQEKINLEQSNKQIEEVHKKIERARQILLADKPEIITGINGSSMVVNNSPYSQEDRDQAEKDLGLKGQALKKFLGGEGTPPEFNKDSLFGQQTQYDSNRDFWKAQLGSDTEKYAKDGAAAKKEEASELKSKLRERELLLSQADQDALAKLKQTHEVTLEEEIKFWEARLQLEKQFKDRQREINSNLGNLKQQQFREGDRDKERGRDETAQGMTREDGSADYQKQMQFWAQLAEAETNAEKRAAMLQKVLRAGIEAVRQHDADMVRQDKEAFDDLATDHIVSVSETIAFWKKIADSAEKGSKEYEAAVAAMVTAEKQLPKERLQAAYGALNQKHTDAQDALGDQEKQASANYELSAQNPSDKMRELVAIRNLHQAEYQEQVQFYAQMKALALQNNDQAASRRADQELLAARKRYNQQVIGDNLALTQQMNLQWTQFFNKFNQQFQSSIQKWMLGQQKFGKSMTDLWNSMVVDLENALLQMALKWAEHEALILLHHVVTNQLKVASDGTSGAESDAIKSAFDFKDKARDAAAAARKAFKAAMDLPVPVNFVVAPIAAAGAFAAVMAFEQGGFTPDTPGGIPAMLHAKEMVLPQKYAQPFKDAVDSGSLGGNKGGDSHTHIHYSPTVHAYGAGSMSDVLKQHSTDIHDIVKRGQRTGHLPSWK